MNCKSMLPVVVMVASALTAGASTITGKVSGGSGESVVYVDTIQGKNFQPPAPHAVMDQKDLLFQPHVLVVQTGATVDFVNSDRVDHNVYWPSIVEGSKKLPGKNLGTWPQGEKRSFTFDQAGVVSVLCNVHPEMAGYVLVVPTPYYAKSDKDGNYKIENVPDGQLNVVAWREGVKSQSRLVSVKGDSKADFSLSK